MQAHCKLQPPRPQQLSSQVSAILLVFANYACHQPRTAVAMHMRLSLAVAAFRAVGVLAQPSRMIACRFSYTAIRRFLSYVSFSVLAKWKFA